jgi:hypothetical protein
MGKLKIIFFFAGEEIREAWEGTRFFFAKCKNLSPKINKKYNKPITKSFSTI